MNSKIEIVLTTTEACWVRDAFQAAALLYSEAKTDHKARWCRAFASGLQGKIDEKVKTACIEERIR
jgi:hypothetical protein